VLGKDHLVTSINITSNQHSVTNNQYLIR